jgi:hypothetical protein
VNESNDTPPLIAAPRHLRRRFLHEEIADELLVPGADPLDFRASPPARKAVERPVKPARSSYARKRLVALALVVVVSLTIPALILALVLGG